MSAPDPKPYSYVAPAVRDARARTRKGSPTLDAVTTIREDGSRRFLHPADVKGRFTAARRISGWLLIAFYLALPWFNVGGNPALFLDIANGRFHLFGITLAFQDTWVLFFAISGLGFALFFVTSLLGRVWCGYACPQTVFLDHVYRRIERVIEGDATRRALLDAEPWTFSKVLRRGTKHVAYIAASLVIAHLFLAYFVSLRELWTMVHHAPGEHWGAFAFTTLFAGALYGNFAWFREQLCIIICPYGRLQSALIDDHSLIIGYDSARGEPRGKLGIPDAGACIDCNRCVSVCPTGIDIRHGLQMECIGCAACIDACDQVMTKIERPTGLIRYDSLAGFRGEKTKWVRGRTMIYAALLAVGAAVALLTVSKLRPANFEITRIPGAPYIVSDTEVRNQFLVRLVNKRNEPVIFQLQVASAQFSDVGWNAPIQVGPLAEDVRPLVLRVPLESYSGKETVEIIVVETTHSVRLENKVTFLGPDPKLLRRENSHGDR